MIDTIEHDLKNDPDARYRDLVHYFEGVLAASGGREYLAKRFSDIPPLEERTGASWAIDKWLLKNAVNALFGETPQTYQSHVMVNMLLCVATGTPWSKYEGATGYAVDGPRDVILFVGENYEDLLNRIDAAIKSEGFNRKLAKKHLAIVPDVYTLDSADGLASMADEIEELNSYPAIIAIDPYSGALDGNEDGSDEAKRAIRGLRALATRYDAAGLVLHHPGREDTKCFHRSSAFCTNMDVMIFCERFLGSAQITSLTQYKNRSADKTLYRAAFVGRRINFGVNSFTGELIVSKPLSPVNPSAVPN